MKRYIISLSIFFLIGLCGQAEISPIEVTVRIETSGTTVFSGVVEVSDCVIFDSRGKKHKFDQYEAVCALDSAAKSGGFTYKVEDQYIGLYLLSIADYEEDIFNYWLYWVNYQMAPVGISSYELSDGDSVLFALTGWENLPLELIASELITTEENAEIYTLAINYETGQFEPVGNINVFINDEEYVSLDNGLLETSFAEPGEYQIIAEHVNYIRSPVHTLLVELPEIPEEPPENPPDEPPEDPPLEEEPEILLEPTPATPPPADTETKPEIPPQVIEPVIPDPDKLPIAPPDADNSQQQKKEEPLVKESPKESKPIPPAPADIQSSQSDLPKTKPLAIAHELIAVNETPDQSKPIINSTPGRINAIIQDNHSPASSLNLQKILFYSIPLLVSALAGFVAWRYHK